jgi:hypothetical protein
MYDFFKGIFSLKAAIAQNALGLMVADLPIPGWIITESSVDNMLELL